MKALFSGLGKTVQDALKSAKSTEPETDIILKQFLNSNQKEQSVGKQTILKDIVSLFYTKALLMIVANGFKQVASKEIPNEIKINNFSEVNNQIQKLLEEMVTLNKTMKEVKKLLSTQQKRGV